MNNINNCNVQIIEGADHLYIGKYEELGRIIRNNID
jgi:alpha/beta superfamily hydrolase